MAYDGAKTLLVVDIAVVIDSCKLVLITRKQEPELVKLVLPGGHVDTLDLRHSTLDDPSVAHACAREALEEINLSVHPEELQFLMFLDAPQRDARELISGEDRRISACFVVYLNSEEDRVQKIKAGSDAKSVDTYYLADIKPYLVGFDHYRAIEKLQAEYTRRFGFWGLVDSGETIRHEHLCVGMRKISDPILGIFWKPATDALPGHGCLSYRNLGQPAQTASISHCPFCGKEIKKPLT